MLRERFARLVEEGADPERIVLFTLSRRAARDARDHLIRRLRRSLPGLPVYTVHGYAFRTVVGRHFRELDYEEPPQVLSAPEQYASVREMLAIERKEDWPALGSLLEVPAFARQVADFVLRCQERLLSPEAVEEMAHRVGRPGHLEVAAFYRRYLDALGEAGQVDFAGLLFQSVALLDRGVPEPDRFEHVLVDDYQDVTHAGEAIVAALARAAESVVVAADAEGHVFSYRGGSLEPLRRADDTFSPLARVELTKSHRLGDRLSALAGLETPGPGEAVPREGFEARLFAHPGEEVEAVAHELLRLRVEDDVAWSDMAVVLRRYGGYLTALRHALARHGIPYVVVAEQAALGTEPAVRPLIDLLRYVFQEERREQLLEPLLSSPIVGLDPTALRRLRREARAGGETVRELVEDGAGSSLPPELQGPVDRFRSLLRDIPELVAGHGPDGLFFELWRRLPHFAELVASGDPRRRRDLDALTAFAGVLTRFAERRPGSGVEDYLETLEAAEFGPDPWIPAEERRPEAVRVLSAHLAQGLEFEAVLVAGCLEGEFPSLSHAYPLVSLDPLVVPRSPPERIAERLAEERALFRLAVSRARRKTVLLASSSTGARTPRSPSRFAARLGLRWSAAAEQAPPATSLRSMEAELRGRLSDGSGEPADRLSAAAALPVVGARPASWWGWRDWTGPDEPLYPLDEPIHTSYSRLSTLENCALQYLYQVELGLDPDQSFQMWLGSLVHDIIDRVQREELPRDLEAMYGALDERWRPEVFPNRAIEHRRYLDARDMLVRWFHHEQAEPEMSEVWFEFPLDGAVIRGRIDAIFRMNNGHVRVVDYKTSRFPISEREAKEDLQLAAYYLALRRTPELADLGETGYLQLAYLGKGHQQTGFVRRDVPPKTVRPDYEAWAEERIRELLQRIREEAFAPNPEANCDFCRFKPICPRWPEGGEVLGAPAVRRPGREAAGR